MQVLQGAATDLIRVVTGSAADIEVTCDYVEYDQAAAPPVPQGIEGTVKASITSATTTTILTGSATSTRRRVIKFLSLFNRSATPSTILVERNDNTNQNGQLFCNLLMNEVALFTESGIWIHLDANGAAYPSIGNAASQAEMEAGTATDKYVTPQGFNWHPGAAKCSGKAVGAGTSLTVNWNISGITDTGTGRLGVTIGTDFSSANYAICASVERVSTSLAVANVDLGAFIRNASPAAGSFEIENYDETATTNVAQDPTSYFWSCFGDQ